LRGMVVGQIDKEPTKLFVMCPKVYSKLMMDHLNNGVYTKIKQTEEVLMGKAVEFYSKERKKTRKPRNMVSKLYIIPKSTGKDKKKGWSTMENIRIRPITGQKGTPAERTLKFAGKALSFIFTTVNALLRKRHGVSHHNSDRQMAAVWWTEQMEKAKAQNEPRRKWVKRVVELDMNDMFTNTSSTLAMQAVEWAIQYISHHLKDRSGGNIHIRIPIDNHRLKPAFRTGNPQHYWNVTARRLLQIIKYDTTQGGYFTAVGQRWKQKRGLPMGSSISAQLAEIALLYTHYKERKCSNIIQHPWTRFRDNIILLVQCPQEEIEEKIRSALIDLQGYCNIGLKIESVGTEIESLGFRLTTEEGEPPVTVASPETMPQREDT